MVQGVEELHRSRAREWLLKGGMRRKKQLIVSAELKRFGLGCCTLPSTVVLQMTTSQLPHSDLHWGQVLDGLLSNTLTLDWPESSNPVIRKLGQACLKNMPQVSW